jgi:hypothetical protein
MCYYYSIYITHIENYSAAKIVGMIMEQAHITTRNERKGWKLKLNAVCINVQFTHKQQRDEFAIALEQADGRYIDRCGLVYTDRVRKTADEWVADAQRLMDEDLACR